MRRSMLAALAAPLIMAFTNQPLTETGPPMLSDEEQIALGVDAVERMTVPVEINGAGPFDFVIDTGAERTMITHELAAELNLPQAGDVMLHTISGLHAVPMYDVERLTVSRDGVDNLRAPAVDRSRLGAAGLLGLDSLQNSRVRLDMKTDTMTVIPSERRESKRPKRERGVITIVAERVHGRMILTRAELDRVPVRIILDTGAQVSVGNEALRRALIRRAKAGEEVSLIGVVGDRLTGNMGRIRSLAIDKLTLSGGSLVFSDAPVFAELGLEERPALLLGMSMLRAFDNVEIDFPNRQVAFDLPPQAMNPGLLRHNCRGSRISNMC